MVKNRTSQIRSYIKWILWVLLVQTILVNISASIYAYKFTHFYDEPVQTQPNKNIFQKTWKLFVGPKFYKNTVESPPSFPYENVILKTPDSISLDAWYSSIDSAKACVVFFHGITVNKSYLDKEASMFRQWGYNILMVDFRAHGKSEGHTSSFGMKETREVQQAFEYAKKRGNEKIILYGVSLGAGVCIKAVAELGLKPSAIIADMPFGTLHEHLKSRARVLGFPEEPFATLVTFWIGIERGYNGFKHSIAGYAKDVHCPVLVQWGEKDQYVRRSEIDKVFENLGSSEKKLVIYPDADHESFLSVDPNKWTKEVNDFMNGIPL